MRIRTLLLKAGRSVAALALAVLAIGVYTAHATTTNTPAVDEQAINKQVHRALVTLPWYGVFDNLQYSINGTEVTLSGQVLQPGETKSDAEKAVRHVEGVTRVVNNIQVLPLSTFDDRIRRAEFRAIFSDPSLGRYAQGPIPSIHIIVSNGHVTLDGVVMNQMDYNIARMRALGVPGVFSVTNNLQIG